MERLAAGDSPVHRLHPAAKLAGAAVFIVAVISMPQHTISGLTPFFFYPLILMALSGTPYRPLLLRLLAALPFPMMGGLANLLFMRDAALSVGGLVISVGTVAFVSIMLKASLCVLAVLILMATTSFYDICGVLTELRVPKVICLQLLMTYRYLHTLTGEVASMYTAYALRAPGWKGIRMKDMGAFAGQLLLRSFDRAERVYRAMQCRGFKGAYIGGRRSKACASDWGYAALVSLCALLLRFVDLARLIGVLFV